MTAKQSRASRLTLLAPATLLILVFFVAPAVLCVFYSFTNLALTGAEASNLSFVGLLNYAKMFRDSSVSKSIVNTVVFTLGSIIGQSILGFSIAYLIRERSALIRRIVGSLVIASWVIPEVVAAACLNAFFGDGGTLNTILKFFGIKKISWLFSYPMLTVVLANIWRGTAFSMLNYQAALDGVDNAILESAMLDGCRPYQSILHIILPVLKGTIATNSMLTTLSTLGGFGLIWILTGGGPRGKTSTMAILMYVKAFQNSQLGYGVAISMVLLVIGVIFGVFYVKMLGGGEQK